MNTKLVSPQQAMQKVPGLNYIASYLDKAQQQQLIETIDKQEWSNDLHRRTQHYGYRYFFQTGMIYPFSYLGKFPEWLQKVADSLYHQNIVCEIPHQALINEYLPGQGIGGHVDTIACFGEEVVSISLVSECFMLFKNKETKEKVAIVLEPGSMVAMKGVARYQWTHGIKKSEVELVEDKEIVRDRRLAITLRTAEWKPFSATCIVGENLLTDAINALFPENRIHIVAIFPQKSQAADGEWYCREDDFLYVQKDANIDIALDMANQFSSESLYFIHPHKNIHINKPKKHLITITGYNYQNFIDCIHQLHFVL